MKIAQAIESVSPDIVWVGLGAPRQEGWMYDFSNRLTVPVLIGVGAAFDFHAGKLKQAPVWIQENGLEWFYRLVHEPKRLWRRYLVKSSDIRVECRIGVGRPEEVRLTEFSPAAPKPRPYLLLTRTRQTGDEGIRDPA